MANRVAELIRYFLERVPNAGRTQVIKFLYLADLQARRCLGKPLSDLNYILYQHGPFDSDVLAALDMMETKGFIQSERFSYCGGTGYSYKPTDRPVPQSFTNEEAIILAYVVETIRHMPLRNLLEDIVYQTKPMVDAIGREAYGSRLKMEIVNNETRIPGLEPERVMQAIKDLDEGKGRSFKEILAALHG